MAQSDDDWDFDMFKEPKGYHRPEKQPTTATHTFLDGQQVQLRLVGENPLWGHHLWNAGRTLATYLESHAEALVRDKTVLELGAGAGLPSLICARNGAKSVVVTDYPDAELISNLVYNIEHWPSLPQPRNIVARGYLWGAPLDDIKALALPEGSDFDVLILADLLFNHSEHPKLLSTVQNALKRTEDAQALVFFTPYRPWLLSNDLAFFDLARSGGLVVEKIFEKVMEKVMFEEDPGDELLRRTVFGYRMTWPAVHDQSS